MNITIMMSTSRLGINLIWLSNCIQDYIESGHLRELSEDIDSGLIQISVLDSNLIPHNHKPTKATILGKIEYLFKKFIEVFTENNLTRNGVDELYVISKYDGLLDTYTLYDQVELFKNDKNLMIIDDKKIQLSRDKVNEDAYWLLINWLEQLSTKAVKGMPSNSNMLLISKEWFHYLLDYRLLKAFTPFSKVI